MEMPNGGGMIPAADNIQAAKKFFKNNGYQRNYRLHFYVDIQQKADADKGDFCQAQAHESFVVFYDIMRAYGRSVHFHAV